MKCKHNAGYDNGTTDCQLCGADMETCYMDTQERVEDKLEVAEAKLKETYKAAYMLGYGHGFIKSVTDWNEHFDEYLTGLEK